MHNMFKLNPHLNRMFRSNSNLNRHLTNNDKRRLRCYFFKCFAWAGSLLFSVLYVTMMLAEVPPASLSKEEATAFQNQRIVRAFITLFVTLSVLVSVHFATFLFLKRFNEPED